jgi:hypothetical protein
MNRCAECAEREAAANDRKQHGRLHALDLLLVDVKLVGLRNSLDATIVAHDGSATGNL